MYCYDLDVEDPEPICLIGSDPNETIPGDFQQVDLLDCFIEPGYPPPEFAMPLSEDAHTRRMSIVNIYEYPLFQANSYFTGSTCGCATVERGETRESCAATNSFPGSSLSIPTSLRVR